MSFPFYIARRYLFARKSHHAINVISFISVLGVAVATMALVCTLSVFNGFHSLVASLFTAFDPQLKIVPATGKTFIMEQAIGQDDEGQAIGQAIGQDDEGQDDEGQAIGQDDEGQASAQSAINKVKTLDCVQAVSYTLEDHALARYGNRQTMVMLKGVDDNFALTTDIYQTLYGHGLFRLHADVLEYGIPGIRLATALGMDANFIDPLLIYTPTPGARVNLMAPDESFNLGELNSAGVVFSVGQKKYDQEYILCSLGFAQRAFEKEGRASALEVRLKDGVSPTAAKRRIEAVVGKDFRVLDRYEQQQDVFRIMKIEKYMAYVFLTFILFIACFNIVGSLGMLIVEKKRDVATLRNLGATSRQIRSIFLFEGRMISVMGAVLGVVGGLALCLGQMHWGWLKMGDKAGAFIVDAYPVVVDWGDVALVFLTVVGVSFVVSWWPVHYISGRLLATKPE